MPPLFSYRKRLISTMPSCYFSSLLNTATARRHRKEIPHNLTRGGDRVRIRRQAFNPSLDFKIFDTFQERLEGK